MTTTGSQFSRMWVIGASICGTNSHHCNSRRFEDNNGIVHRDDGGSQQDPGWARYVSICSRESAIVSWKGGIMQRNFNVNPTSEHDLYLRLFITNGGGW